MKEYLKPCPVCNGAMSYETELKQWVECSKCGYTQDADIFKNSDTDFLLRDEIAELHVEVDFLVKIYVEAARKISELYDAIKEEK